MGTNIVLNSSDAAEAGGDPGDPDYVYTFTLGEGRDGEVVVDLFEEVGAGFPEVPVDQYLFAGLTADEIDAIDFQLDGGTIDPDGTGSTTTGGFSFSINVKQLVGQTDPIVIEFTVTGQGGLAEDTDTVTIILQVCVAAGTGILTPDGYRAVETLEVGDPVELADGRIEPVRWINSRYLDAAALRHQPNLRPILIRNGAFGPGRPYRDLRVSPQHRIALEGWRTELLFGEPCVLASAKSLIDDNSVCVDHASESVEYFHILFERHEIMVTDGLATESFFPGPYSLAAVDRPVLEELYTLFPELRENGASYGKMAVRGLKAWEAQIFQDPPAE
ncbi:MAG: Hint domain-containing protein [Rhodobacteraceae bacterium]|nr:Hint domain-containing protein [Paracoccaceae bacterium]